MASYAVYEAINHRLGERLLLATVLVITPIIIGLALRHRANDAMLSPRELAIIGGRHHGFRLDWSAIEGDASRVETVRGRHALVLRAGYGTRIELASHRSEHELRSLTNLLGSIRTWARRAEQPAEPQAIAPDGVQVIRCTRCGAQVAPSEQAQVSCAHCAAPVAIPEAVRELVRIEREGEVGDPLPERAVRSLLALPSARTANLALFALCIYACCIAPLSVGLDSLIYSYAAYAVLVALALGMRLWLVDRSALQLLTLNFGARPPLYPNEPRGCRMCGGPLPQSSDTVTAGREGDIDRIVLRSVEDRGRKVLRVLAESSSPMAFSVSRNGARIAREHYDPSAISPSVVIEDAQGKLLAIHPNTSDPVLSPDGEQFLVIVKPPIDVQGQRPSHQLRGLDALSGKELGSLFVEDCESPRWAPSGKRVALECSYPDVLRLFSPESKTPEAVLMGGCISGHDWKDDTTLILSTRAQTLWRHQTAVYALKLDAGAVGAGR